MNPMISNTTVIIPTYWTWPLNANHRPETASYDHPTPLDGDSALPRLLDDLCEQSYADFSILILTGASHPELGRYAADHVRTLIQPYIGRLDLYVCDAPTWGRLKEVLEATGLPTDGLHLGSYGGIRNLQLLVPHIMDSKIVVALDDDESVDSDYLKRAHAYLGREINGQRVLGLAGPYLQPDGSVLLPERPPTGNPLRDKGLFINKAMQQLISARGSLVQSPMALGGNMVFHRDLFTRVPFDPGITRGEDIDYLINARLAGINWWFDPELTILHLPPHHYDTPPYQRMREDVFRFIYEREKLRFHGYAQPDWLEPYPGALLSDDLNEQALSALEAEATVEMVARFGDAQTILEQAEDHASHHAPLYTGFAQSWRQVMIRIEQDDALRRELRDCF